MIELLSPAGSMASLIAAIEAGCDAVYLGGTMFGARAFANNFNNEEMIEAINYAHLYGVKVYVTVNILIYEHEVSKFLDYIEFLHKNNVDAIIVQDLGMLDLVHKTFPNLELHASTQMHIHNLDGVIMAEKLGVKRVVLARETPIEVIKDIKKHSHIDLEIFAHGALCVSYSGQCLFSSLIGHRSGNRGSCVGSCRLPYKIVDEHEKRLNEGDYPLSMKDLNTLNYVGELIDAGVCSLKIEGRMKSAEYVYTATKLYRLAIDSYYRTGKVSIDNQELINLKRIFNRQFTCGYLFNEKMTNIINDKRPNHQGEIIGRVINYQKGYVYVKLYDSVSINDGLRILDNEDYGVILNEFYINHQLVKKASKDDIIVFKVGKNIKINSQVLLTKDSRLIDSINQIISKHKRRILIDGKIVLNSKKPISIFISDGKNEIYLEGEIPLKAFNKPITKDEIIAKMNKLGDSVYAFRNLNVVISENVFVPIKHINELRRKAITLLNEKRLYKYNFIKKKYDISLPDFPVLKEKSLLMQSGSDINVNKDEFDRVYSEIKMNSGVILKIPKIIANYDKYSQDKEYLVGELGAFNKLKNINCDYSFNACNSYTVALLHSLGAKRITLSYELSFEQIKNILDAYHHRFHKHPNLEVVVYGKREVMALKTNLCQIYGKKTLFLVDRFNNHYLIKENDGINYIYDYKTIDYKDDFYSLGINSIRKNY